MELSAHLRFAVAIVALFAAAPVDAADSTSAPHPSMTWQAPLARGPSGGFNCPSGSVMTATGNGTWGCTNTITDAANATTSQYANDSGQLGGNGMPTCPIGYALSGNGTNWSCVSNVSTAGYATTSGNGVASVSGTTLSTTNGTNYTLPSGGGGGGPAACSAMTYTWYDDMGNYGSYWSMAGLPIAWENGNPGAATIDGIVSVSYLSLGATQSVASGTAYPVCEVGPSPVCTTGGQTICNNGTWTITQNPASFSL